MEDGSLSEIPNKKSDWGIILDPVATDPVFNSRIEHGFKHDPTHSWVWYRGESVLDGKCYEGNPI